MAESTMTRAAPGDGEAAGALLATKEPVKPEKSGSGTSTKKSRLPSTVAWSKTHQAATQSTPVRLPRVHDQRVPRLDRSTLVCHATPNKTPASNLNRSGGDRSASSKRSDA